MTESNGDLRVVAQLGAQFDRRLQHEQRGRSRMRLAGSRLAFALALGGTFIAAAAAGAATGLFAVGDEIAPDQPPAPGQPPAGLEEEKVLATGSSPVAGHWQISGYQSNEIVDQGEVLQPAGLPCLRILLVERQVSPLGGSGYCGTSRDFKVASVPATDGREVEVLLWGPAPEEAATVELRAAGGIKLSAPVHDGPPEYEGDLWVIPAPHTLEDARMVWLDGDGRVSAPREASTSLQGGESVAGFLRELRERGQLPE
jgi:hypothetical protein